MTQSPCDHPDPDLCRRLGLHIHGRLWEIWSGIDVDPTEAQRYRVLLVRRAAQKAQEQAVATSKSGGATPAPRRCCGG